MDSGDQLDIFDALGAVIPSRTTDPDTSHAAEPVKIKAGSQRARLLEAFYAQQRSWEPWAAHAMSMELPPETYGRDGLTDEQAMTKAVGVSPTSEYSKRCSELREAGLIEPTGETRPGSAGPQRIVSRITPKGAAWIRENR